MGDLMEVGLKTKREYDISPCTGLSYDGLP